MEFSEIWIKKAMIFILEYVFKSAFYNMLINVTFSIHSFQISVPLLHILMLW